jgi:hypothetical protein
MSHWRVKDAKVVSESFEMQTDCILASFNETAWKRRNSAQNAMGRCVASLKDARMHTHKRVMARGWSAPGSLALPRRPPSTTDR